MPSNVWFNIPRYVLTIAFLTFFFLSCTKKPSTDTAAAANPMNVRNPAAAAAPKGMITTKHGYHVMLEPAQFGNPPKDGQQAPQNPAAPGATKKQ
jgi:hypothetical protein